MGDVRPVNSVETSDQHLGDESSVKHSSVVEFIRNLRDAPHNRDDSSSFERYIERNEPIPEQNDHIRADEKILT